MAFKILFGNEVNLPNEMVAGHLYCCTDSGNAFFDYPVAGGTAARKQISAEAALKLLYNNGEGVVELLPEDIATKDDVAAAAGDVVKTVDSVDEMVDEHKLYIYTGVEPDMIEGALYYYNGWEWLPVSSPGEPFDPVGIPGGTAGQVLTKNSSNDGDYSWGSLPESIWFKHGGQFNNPTVITDGADGVPFLEFIAHCPAPQNFGNTNKPSPNNIIGIHAFQLFEIFLSRDAEIAADDSRCSIKRVQFVDEAGAVVSIYCGYFNVLTGEMHTFHRMYKPVSYSNHVDVGFYDYNHYEYISFNIPSISVYPGNAWCNKAPAISEVPESEVMRAVWKAGGYGLWRASDNELRLYYKSGPNISSIMSGLQIVVEQEDERIYQFESTDLRTYFPYEYIYTTFSGDASLANSVYYCADATERGGSILAEATEFAQSMIGDLNNLNTDSKDSIVTAINEVAGRDSGGVPDGGTEGQILIKNSGEDGDASWQDLPTFDGSYTIVPMIGAETQMNTAQTYLDRNITVERIPVYVTQNDSGGNTVIIGG